MSDKRKYFSTFLKAVTIVWISFPAIYILGCFFAFKAGLVGVAKLILSPWFWFVGGISVWSGYSIRQLRSQAWYLFVFSNILIAYENAVTLTYFAQSQNRIATYLVLVVLQIIVILLVARELRVPYFSPRISWWESDPRYKLSILAKIDLGNEFTKAEIVDLSRGGCFIKSNKEIPLDSKIKLEFDLYDNLMRCDGVVVWKTERTITHPKGIGVRFLGLDSETKKTLKDITKRLRDIAHLRKETTKEKTWQDYMAREKEYQRGEGKPRESVDD